MASPSNAGSPGGIPQGRGPAANAATWPPDLPQGHELLEAIFQQQTVGVALIETGTGRFLRVNQRYAEIVGYPVDDLLTRTFLSITHPEDVAEGAARHQKFASGAAREYQIEKRYVRPDGTIVHGAVAVSSLGPVHQPCRYNLAFLTDITARQQAEAALRESESQYRELVEGANSIIVRWDRKGKITFINTYGEKFFGFPREQLIGRHVVGTLVPENESTGRDLRRMMAEITRNPAAFEQNINENQCRDGRRVWVQWTNKAVLDPAGHLVEVFSIGLDITARRQAEAALAENELRLRESQRIGRIGSWHYDVRSDRLSWTEESYRLYGVPPEQFELTLASFLGLIHPDDRAAMEGWIADCQAGQSPPEMIFRCLHPDGTLHWLCGRGERVLDAAGQAVAMTGTVQDITGRMRAEAALRESEERYRALFERSTDCVFLCDFTGRFLDANQAALDLLGYSVEDIPTLDFAALLTPDQVPRAFQTVQEVLRTGRQLVPTEYRLRRKDGQFVIVETQSALIYHEGVPHAIQGIGRDMTARRAAEAAEREARQLLRSVLDTVPVRVFWKDCASRYLGCNLPFAQDLGLASPDDLVGKDDFAVSLPEYAERYRSDDREVITTGRAKLNYEEPLAGPDGRKRWLRTSKTPLRDAQGRIIGVLGTYEDITGRKELEEAHAQLQEQLLQSQKMESIGRLAGGIAHDFNNMLQAILGNVELALMDLPPRHPVRELLGDVQRSAERSASLTSQLLAFARKQTISPRVLDLNDEINSLLRMFRRLIGEDIQLLWAPGAGLWPVLLDPGQLNQALANLVVNARDAIGTAPKGRISIETQNVQLDDTYASTHPDCVPGDYIMVAVSDNGCGMDDQVREKLFEPFFTTKEVGKGTGLGLATVYGIMKQNRGLVSVYSEPGQGAVFKLYFPRAQAGPAGSEPAAPAGQVALDGQETILLVEDEMQVLELGRRLLERRGYRVLAAASPEEALALAARQAGAVDLLITDVVMPGMNGRELRERLLPQYPRMRCLFMSGYTADVIAHHGVLEAGIEFLAKPFTSQSLAQRVRQVLDAKD